MIPAGAFTAAGMFIALYYALMKGKLYTRRSHDEIVTIKDQQIADGKAQVVLWRAVGETSQAQMTELLEHSRMSVQLLTSIDSRSKDGHE
jgi:hypothetical protein